MPGITFSSFIFFRKWEVWKRLAWFDRVLIVLFQENNTIKRKQDIRFQTENEDKLQKPFLSFLMMALKDYLKRKKMGHQLLKKKKVIFWSPHFPISFLLLWDRQYELFDRPSDDGKELKDRSQRMREKKWRQAESHSFFVADQTSHSWPPQEEKECSSTACLLGP